MLGQVLRERDRRLSPRAALSLDRAHVHDAVRVAVERHDDLDLAARRAPKTAGLKLAEQLVGGGLARLALAESDTALLLFSPLLHCFAYDGTYEFIRVCLHVVTL